MGQAAADKFISPALSELKADIDAAHDKQLKQMPMKRPGGAVPSRYHQAIADGQGVSNFGDGNYCPTPDSDSSTPWDYSDDDHQHLITSSDVRQANGSAKPYTRTQLPASNFNDAYVPSWFSEPFNSAMLATDVSLLAPVMTAGTANNISITQANALGQAVSAAASTRTQINVQALNHFLWASNGGWANKAAMVGVSNIGSIALAAGDEWIGDMESPSTWIASGAGEVSKAAIHRSSVLSRLSAIQASRAANMADILETMDQYDGVGLFSSNGQYISKSQLEMAYAANDINSAENAQLSKILGISGQFTQKFMLGLNIGDSATQVYAAAKTGRGTQAFFEQSGKLVGEYLGEGLGVAIAGAMAIPSEGGSLVLSVPIIAVSSAATGIVFEKFGDAVYYAGSAVYHGVQDANRWFNRG